MVLEIDNVSDSRNVEATQHPNDGTFPRRRWQPRHGTEYVDDFGSVEKGLRNNSRIDDENDDKKWHARSRCLFFSCCCHIGDPSSLCRQRRWGFIVVLVVVLALVVLLMSLNLLVFGASPLSSILSIIIFEWSPPLPNTVHNPNNIIVGGNSMTSPLARNEQQHHKGLPIPVRHSPTTPTVRILYVHIGKTGGELVKAQLGPALCKTRKNKLLKEACLKRFRVDGGGNGGVGGGDSSGTTTMRTTTTKDGAVPPSHNVSTPTTYVYTSLLSQRTIGYMHVHNPIVPKNALQVATHYLYSIRHPLSRLVSWYVYNHPKSCDMREPNSPSCKSASAIASAAAASASSSTRDDDVFWTVEFYRCFPTVADWVNKVIGGKENGSNNNNKDDDDDDDHRCVTLFWDGWYGRVKNLKHPNHLYWNYEFYWNQTLARTPNRRILVVRQESLVEDIQGLEEYLHSLQDVAGIDTETTRDRVPRKGVSTSDSSGALVLIPADSEHFVSGRVSSNLDGPDSSSRIDQPTASLRERRMACCALFRVEWPIYMTLIQRADNLNMDEQRRSLHEAWTLCGVVGDVATDGQDTVVDVVQDHRTEAEMLLHYTITDWKETFEALACA